MHLELNQIFVFRSKCGGKLGENIDKCTTFRAIDILCVFVLEFKKKNYVKVS